MRALSHHPQTQKPDYKAGYRRQMEMYQWIARRKGFTVSDTGYFVYVDGQHVGIDWDAGRREHRYGLDEI